MKIREKIRKIGSMLPVLVLGVLACATVALAAGNVYEVYGPNPYVSKLIICEEKYRKIPVFIGMYPRQPLRLGMFVIEARMASIRRE